MINIAVDLDGVLAEYHGWTGIDNIGKPFSGAKCFLNMLKNEGYQIIIYTARISSRHSESIDVQKARIENWLNQNNLYYDEIWADCGKPIASAYVDDRAVHCDPKDFTTPDTSYSVALASIKAILERKVSNEPNLKT